MDALHDSSVCAIVVPVGGSKPSEKFVEANVKASPGVQTSSYFPKNPLKVVKPGERTQVDIDVINDGQAPLKVIYTRASIHLPHDHRLIVQNFTVQEGTTIVTTGSKGSYSYSFSSNKLLQAGIYDLVGYVVYEIDGGLYKNVFHNGSIDVLENGGFVKGETIFLCSLGLGILGLLGMWAYSQAQNFLKKRKRSYKRVETGTRSSSGALTNDWLQVSTLVLFNFYCDCSFLSLSKGGLFLVRCVSIGYFKFYKVSFAKIIMISC
ncbi:translocon-associated protein subunit alpha isoform X2 [Physcomitrium patens]|uniref:translocon-associated protein subunit alpha isoform X2 n=1 Tax=Physcomitrium patens TaxID=3218 RepID=UPI003CCE2404